MTAFDMKWNVDLIKDVPVSSEEVSGGSEGSSPR